MAKNLEFRCVTVILRQQFCRSCFGKAQSLGGESSCIRLLSSVSEAELEYNHEIVHHEKRKKLGASIKAVEISPISTRNLLPKQRLLQLSLKMHLLIVKVLKFPKFCLLKQLRRMKMNCK